MSYSNSKLWIAALLCVAAQTLSAMDDQSPLTGLMQEDITAIPSEGLNGAPQIIVESAPEVPEAETQKVAELAKYLKHGTAEQPTVPSTPEADVAPTPVVAPSGFSFEALKGKLCAAQEAIAAQGVNMYAFGNENRKFTALMVAIPVVSTLAYKYAPAWIKNTRAYKTIKTKVPTWVKTGFIALIPTAIWLYAYSTAGAAIAVA